MTKAEKEKAREDARRARVVKGWAFRDLPEDQVRSIRSYLGGGPVPAGYENMDRILK